MVMYMHIYIYAIPSGSSHFDAIFCSTAAAAAAAAAAVELYALVHGSSHVTISRLSLEYDYSHVHILTYIQVQILLHVSMFVNDVTN